MSSRRRLRLGRRGRSKRRRKKKEKEQRIVSFIELRCVLVFAYAFLPSSSLNLSVCLSLVRATTTETVY